MATKTNKNRVPAKQWRKWSGMARWVFNDTYNFIYNHEREMNHPKQPKHLLLHWKTLAWNAAWIAADAVDDTVPDEIVDVVRSPRKKRAA